MALAFTKLPFKEASDFLRQKVRLPTKSWRDLQQGMHSRAFVVAGAMKTELLQDMQSAVLKAIEQGTTLREFRRDFDGIVKKHGWTFKQDPGWRAGVIFNTNMRTAFSAGAEAQMQRTKARRPFARYIAGLSAEPRAEHLAWQGTILPLDHPWWSTHTPPNDWGCKCKKVSVSQRELDRDGLKVFKNAPDNGSRPVKDPVTGQTRNLENGIGLSWDYNPGQAAYGQQSALKSMREFKQVGKKFEVLTQGDWRTAGQPELVSLEDTLAKLDFTIPKTQTGMEGALKKILGVEEKVFSFDREGFRYDFNVNAKALAEHLADDPSRAAFLPLLPEVLENPFEIWQTFEKNKLTGKVVLRHRFVKALKTETGDKGILFVTDASNGQMEGLTMIPRSNLKQLNNRRKGKLIFRRE